MELLEKNMAPFPYYREMRQNNPIFFNEDKKIWEIFSYQDIQAVLSDYHNFSSAIFGPDVNSIITSDPPRHTKVRRLLASAFSMKMVNAQTDNVIKIANSLIDAKIENGQIDLVRDFAFFLPAGIIGKLLFLPENDIPRLKPWADAAMRVAEVAMQGGIPDLAPVQEMTEYLHDLATERRKNPGEDLVSALAMAEMEGEKLTIEEIVDTCKVLAIAGFDTTTNLLVNAIHILLQSAELRKEVFSDVVTLESFIDEVLRYAPSLLFLSRVAKQDFELRGNIIKAGQWVVTHTGASNRDENVFADAENFNCKRTSNRHLSFGHGIHYCIGAPLAKLEAKLALPLLFQRLPDLHLDPHLPGIRLVPTMQFGFNSLPAQFTPVKK